ncbi:MAG: DUF1559 domain-containing protein, partial [Planctomycetaceae bacterium]|nr:DUF1559 domain-containing protein [Planctomycetaceae bacterium]
VQQAREAARRSSCKNNLKQLGLALQNYHDVALSFPYNSTPQIGSGASMQRGASWFVRILPYMDQAAAYNQLVFTGDWTAQDGTNPNVPVLNQLRVPILNCPSSPLETVQTRTTNSSGTYTLQLPNYVGICGSYYVGGTTGTVSTYANDNSYGVSVYNGTIAASSSQSRPTRIRDITDGTTNTMMVSEQSDYLYSGTSRKDQRSCTHWGGAWSNGGGAGTWTQNVTTIRYPIGTYAGAGNDTPYSVNNALVSAHVGGVQSLYVDGSVHFISENINFGILTGLADRQDGTPIQAP